MKNVAFIPVRGGSKSIPLKNIRLICGKPLVYWTIKAACECKAIDSVYVATDSEKIKETVKSFKQKDGSHMSAKLHVIGRSVESASDTASTEYAMLEFAEQYDFDNIVLIQATSPLLTSQDLDGGLELFYSAGTDSVLSVVRQYRFLWVKDSKNNVRPTNYDLFHRPRRQEFKGYLMENGAFYITSKKALIESRNRLSGNIKAYEMCEESAFEIDEPSDWIIVESLMRRRCIKSMEKNIPEIKMFLTDCDGCLTDAGMYYSEFGDELKKFNTKDGMAFVKLHERGVITGIITGEDVALNKRRAEKLKLDILESGCRNKAMIIQKLCEKYDISPENVLYIGDDINDLNAMKIVGFSACPADAVSQVKAVADYVAETKGGEGAIREIVDMLYNINE